MILCKCTDIIAVGLACWLKWSQMFFSCCVYAVLIVLCHLVKACITGRKYTWERKQKVGNKTMATHAFSQVALEICVMMASPDGLELRAKMSTDVEEA
jgi:TRAP-type C4-dicarboxylate transport system permease large subunit